MAYENLFEYDGRGVASSIELIFVPRAFFAFPTDTTNRDNADSRTYSSELFG